MKLFKLFIVVLTIFTCSTKAISFCGVSDKASLIMSVPIAEGHSSEVSSSWEDVTYIIKNAGFDEDLTFSTDGTVKNITERGSFSGRSHKWTAEDGTIYAASKTSAEGNGSWKRNDTDHSFNGFLGQIAGWTLETGSNGEWTYFGAVPYGVGETAIPIADDNNGSWLSMPGKPEGADTDDNKASMYLRAGWTNYATYSQTVSLPCAVYRLEYWINNLNYASTDASGLENLCKVTCRKEVFPDEDGVNADGWTKHTIEFTPTSEFTIQLGFRAGNYGSGKNPILLIDGIKLYKIGESEPEIPVSPDEHDDAIYLPDLTVCSGTRITVPINLKCSEPTCGYQFDMYLPHGITFAKDETSEYMVNLGSRTNNNRHTLSCAVQNDGGLRFLCYSLKNDTFSGEDGDIATVILNVTEQCEMGSQEIVFRNIVLTTPNNEKTQLVSMKSAITVVPYVLGDANGDYQVDVVDISATANYILGQNHIHFVTKAADVNQDRTIDVADISTMANMILNKNKWSEQKNVKQCSIKDIIDDNTIYLDHVKAVSGTTQKVAINMRSIEAVSGFQFDMYLPNGVEMGIDEFGEYLFDYSDRTSFQRHDINCVKQQNGAYRFLGYSLKNYDFSGLDGPVINVSLSFSEDMLEGEYIVKICDVVLTTPLSQKIIPENSTSQVEIVPMQPYYVIYVIDGVEYRREAFEFGSTPVLVTEPSREGYTFSGWDKALPETMPAEDIVLNGTFTVNTYNIYVNVDGVQIDLGKLTYGDPIVLPEVTEKEGYTWVWDPSNPTTVPAYDFVLKGAYVPNTYTATYVFMGEVVGEVKVQYGEEIPPFSYTPSDERYTITAWRSDSEYVTMPAKDVTFTADVVDGIAGMVGSDADVQYYSLDGVLLQTPRKGVNIVRRVSADGQIVTSKVLVK